MHTQAFLHRASLQPQLRVLSATGHFSPEGVLCDMVYLVPASLSSGGSRGGARGLAPSPLILGEKRRNN